MHCAVLRSALLRIALRVFCEQQLVDANLSFRASASRSRETTCVSKVDTFVDELHSFYVSRDSCLLEACGDHSAGFSGFPQTLLLQKPFWREPAP